jgi:hypothetical protein
MRNFHKYLCNVYESATVDRRTVDCWVKRVLASETAKAKLHDLPRSGFPVTVVCLELLQHDAIDHEDGHTTTRQVARSLSLNKGSVSHIIQDLGYSKVCTRCVPQNLAVKRKTKRRTISFTLLVCFKAQGETFPSWIITADETWFWRQKGSPQNGTIVNLPRRKNSNIFYQWARSSSLSSVTVQEGFLWQQC